MSRKKLVELKRESTEMDIKNWRALERVAADFDCFYNGKPSWRRLLTRIARADLLVTVAGGGSPQEIAKRENEFRSYRWRQKVERDRLRQENKRRAAGIGPRSAASDLAQLQQEEEEAPKKSCQETKERPKAQTFEDFFAEMTKDSAKL